ncbi:MAG: single-stranded DNA-binding protein [Dethiobacteria bacterium]
MLNKVILIGRLAQEPELRYTATEGTAVTNFNLAVERPFTNQKGEKEADFIRIVTWRKLAENCSTYLSKGSKVAVEGRLQIRSFEDREGIRRNVAEVVANNVVFLDSRRDTGGDTTANENSFAREDVIIRDEDVPF